MRLPWGSSLHYLIRFVIGRSLKVIERSLEYAAAETGKSPVYLYRFWIDTDPGTEWRLNGFSWDHQIDGHTWTTKRITHSQIQRSTRADTPDFTIECERDPDIPVIHLVPPALSLPLNVEVRESLSLADAGNVIAIGRVQSVRASCRGLNEVRYGHSIFVAAAEMPDLSISPRRRRSRYLSKHHRPKLSPMRDSTLKMRRETRRRHNGAALGSSRSVDQLLHPGCDLQCIGR